MTFTVPTNEPDQLRAGDSWQWDRQDLTDYPATSWTLKYAFKNAAAHIEATASADGSNYSVRITAVTTLAYTAGKYHWVAYVETGAGASIERHQVDEGWLEVLPAFAQASPAALDDRTHARKTLEAIEAVIESRATVDQMKYTIGSRSLDRMPIADLLKFRDYYRAQVRSETLANDAANGKTGGHALVMRLK